jgi:hypothetical protein
MTPSCAGRQDRAASIERERGNGLSEPYLEQHFQVARVSQGINAYVARHQDEGCKPA